MDLLMVPHADGDGVGLPDIPGERTRDVALNQTSTNYDAFKANQIQIVQFA